MRLESSHKLKTAAASGIVHKLLNWFATNARDLPWRRTNDPYAIWVSEIMLQQTQVKTVIAYWERWMRALPDVTALAEASPETVHKLWEGLGYYTRVRNLQKAARLIMAEHNGKFPRDFAAILDLPGIGRYTAGAISSIAYNEARPILDGNVIRVLTRLFGIQENPREKTANENLWRLAEQLVARTGQSEATGAQSTQSRCSHLNQSLMELGALVCTPRQPKCTICPVRSACAALRTGHTEDLPNLGPRTVATARRFVAFVIENNHQFLVRQRPTGVVNAHLWEFPNIESEAKPSSLQAMVKEELGLAVNKPQPLATIRHSITRYRISLHAYRCRLASGPAGHRAGGVWLGLADLDKLAFTSAHRKILGRLSPLTGKQESLRIRGG